MAKWFIVFACALVIGIAIGIILLSRVGVSRDTTMQQERLTQTTRDGVHYFAGNIALRHSCYVVNVQQGVVAADGTFTIRVAVDEADPRPSTCAEFTTRYPFEVFVDHDGAVTPTLVINGFAAPITLVRLQR